MTTQEETTYVNGVNVDRLRQTISAIKDQPELAHFKFRAETEWVSGAQSHTRIKGFYGGGAEDTSRHHPFILEGDEPTILLGANAGPNAVETILHGLAAGLAAGFIYAAAAQNIRVISLQFRVEGEIDIQGFFGIADATHSQQQGIHISYTVKSDAPQERIQELFEQVQQTSPVLAMLRGPVPVTVELQQ